MTRSRPASLIGGGGAVDGNPAMYPCIRFTAASKKCYSGLVVPFAARSQNQVWENLVSHPSEGWDKRKSWGRGFRHKISSLWVDSQVATSDVELQAGLGELQSFSVFESSRLGEKIRSLCAMGQVDKALDTIFCMHHHAPLPLLHMYSYLLTECSKRKALAQAKRIYAHLVKHGLEYTSSLGEAVVCTLIKCGSMKDAVQVFRTLPYRTLVSWKPVLSEYIREGQGQEALRLYWDMREEGLKPDTYTFVILIKACSTIADLKRIHAEALKYRSETDLFVSTCLVNSYAKCGSIVDAQSVFDELPQRNAVTCNAMLAALVQHDQVGKALQLYERMLEDGISHDDRTFVKALQACGMLAEKEEWTVVDDGQSNKVNSIARGKIIHGEAWQRGYRGDLFVSSSLVSMYGKCGSVLDAQNVFNQIMHQDLVSWNSLLAAYVQQGQAEKALELYEKMMEGGVSPNDRTVVSALQACAVLAEKQEVGESIKMKALGIGRALHAEAQRKGYEADIFVGNSLVSMYGKCGNIVQARKVFDALSVRDVVSWNTMLTVYAQLSEGEMALEVYEQMQLQGASSNDRTFVNVLQVCGMLADKEDAIDKQLLKVKSLAMGKALHADALRKGYHTDGFVCSSLVSMYGKCGSIADAQNAFDGLSRSDVVSWTVILAAYVQQGQAERVLELYEQMQEEGVSPNVRTLVSTLQACGILADDEEDISVNGSSTKLKSLDKGKAIHADVWRRGYQSDMFVGSTLIRMYSKCGSLADSQNVFICLSQRDVVAWSAILGAYVQQGQAGNALHLYKQMRQEQVSPNIWTFVTMIQACGMLAEKVDGGAVYGESSKVESLVLGKALHANAQIMGCDEDVFLGSTLIKMYGKCGSIADAQVVFDRLNSEDIEIWNAMFAAQVQHGQLEMAWKLYGQMWEQEVSPDVGTLVIALQASAMLAEKEMDEQFKVQSLEKGKAMHAYIWRTGCDSDIFVCNTLITMYGKCGSIADAWCVFDGMSLRDVVSWNAMLAGYVEQAQGDKALELYGQMQQEGVTPTEVTLICILQACSKTGSLDICRQIHEGAISVENHLSPLLATTLIHAYGSCATMVNAQAVFDALPEPSVVSWNTLIAGYAREGDYVECLKRFNEMQLTGTKPDEVTFLSILSACSHAGFVNKGVEFFESMTRDYGLTPQIEHYVTVVDLLGRAGYFTMVEDLLSTMPVNPDLAMWSCLLGTCRKHGKVLLGKRAFDCAVRLDPTQSATYVLMANIYADAGLWDLAQGVKEMRQTEVAWKKPGQSWIQHEQYVHTFLVGDQKHREQVTLYDLLGKLKGVLHT